MKPEYIGIGNFDEDNYVYAHCKCPLPADYAIKWPRIKDGKPHRYTCVCEDCGTEVWVISKSYGPEVLKESGEIKMEVLDKIRAGIEDAAFDSQEIDGEHESVMLVYLDDALNIIDKYKRK